MTVVLSWRVSQALILRAQGPRSLLWRAVGDDWKGRLSRVLYLAGIAASFCAAGQVQALYLAAALIWLALDWRIEKALLEQAH